MNAIDKGLIAAAIAFLTGALGLAWLAWDAFNANGRGFGIGN